MSYVTGIPQNWLDIENFKKFLKANKQAFVTRKKKMSHFLTNLQLSKTSKNVTNEFFLQFYKICEKLTYQLFTKES